MNRRGFLRFLGMGAAAAVAPKVTYSFLGGILRPRGEWRKFSEGEISGCIGMTPLPSREYLMEFYKGQIWIISTTVDNNSTAKCTVSFA